MESNGLYMPTASAAETAHRSITSVRWQILINSRQFQSFACRWCAARYIYATRNGIDATVPCDFSRRNEPPSKCRIPLRECRWHQCLVANCTLLMLYVDIVAFNSYIKLIGCLRESRPAYIISICPFPRRWWWIIDPTHNWHDDCFFATSNCSMSLWYAVPHISACSRTICESHQLFIVWPGKWQ